MELMQRVQRALWNKCVNLLRRMRVARRLGFTFLGTNYTRMPQRLVLFNQTIALSYPDDRGFMGDVINILLDDEYGLGTVRPPVNRILDVGANIGLFSLWARHSFPEAVVHAYEPNDQIFDYAIANLIKANIVLFNEGI